MAAATWNAALYGTRDQRDVLCSLDDGVYVVTGSAGSWALVGLEPRLAAAGRHEARTGRGYPFAVGVTLARE